MEFGDFFGGRRVIPYDNAVAEATFKIIKTEFVEREIFETLEDLTSN